MGELIRLIYVSRAISTALHAKEIVRVAQLHNGEHDLTGVLIATTRLYIQALEGASDTVHALYQRIAKDQRHVDPRVIEVSETDLRLWPGWSMQLLSAAHWEARTASLGIDTYEHAIKSGTQICEHLYGLKR